LFGKKQDASVSGYVDGMSGTAAKTCVGDLGDEKLDELMLRLKEFLGA
jgi:uncharacterized protein YaaN involved in tellurite resistance